MRSRINTSTALLSVVMFMLFVNSNFALTTNNYNVANSIDSLLKSAVKISATDRDKAYELNSSAMKLAVESDNELMIADTEMNYALLNLYDADYYDAYSALNRAMDIFERNGEWLKLAKAYNNIGMIYNKLDDLHTAKRYYLLSYRSYNRLKEERGTVDSRENILYNNIGIIYDQLCNTDSASYFYNQALELCNSTGDDYGKSLVLQNIGKMYHRDDRIDSALYYYNMADILNKERGDVYGTAKVCLALGELNFERGKNDAAIDYFVKAKDIGTELKLNRIVYYASDMLTKIYEARGDTEKAYENLKISKMLGDSISKVASLNKIASLNLQKDIDKARYESELKRQQNFIRAIIISGVLILLVAFVYLIIKRLKSKIRCIQQESEKAREELNSKNKEVTSKALNLVQKSQLLKDISARIVANESLFNKKGFMFLESILKEINNSEDDMFWNEFELHFSSVHQNFYNQLLNDFPDLTNNEKRLCAFLRLNMSTKEISTITRQSSSSINVARTRLRKKLGIAKEEITINSFLSGY